jgi:hypothetical protein
MKYKPCGTPESMADELRYSIKKGIHNKSSIKEFLEFEKLVQINVVSMNQEDYTNWLKSEGRLALFPRLYNGWEYTKDSILSISSLKEKAALIVLTELGE